MHNKELHTAQLQQQFITIAGDTGVFLAAVNGAGFTRSQVKSIAAQGSSTRGQQAS